MRVTGAGFTVDSTTDAVDANPGDGACASAAGECTLRAALQETNALPGADSITIGAGVLTLTIPGPDEDAAATGDLDITDDVTITGTVSVAICAEGSTTCGSPMIETTVDGNGLDRVFDLLGPVSVEMAQLRIQGGNVTGDFAQGGGIRNPFGTVSLDLVEVRGNSAAGGGAIYNGGAMSLS